jgi:DNA modification methylase
MKIDLYHGDCLEIMKLIPDCSIDAIITDPPYGTTACKWDCIIPFEPMWSELKRIIKPNGAIVLFGSQPFTSTLIMSNLKMFKYEWIWQKHQGTNPMMAKKAPMKIHENILVFYSKLTTYNPQMTVGTPYQSFHSKNSIGEVYGSKLISKHRNNPDGTRYPISIQKFTRSKKSVHPTQKPVALIEYLIKTYTNENETVLDFTMGSGTTGVACKNLNRNFIGIELDDKYFEIAKSRIESIQKSELNLEEFFTEE